MKTPSATFQQGRKSDKSKLLWKLLSNVSATEKCEKSLECKKDKQI